MFRIKLKQLREEKGLSQQSFADAFGVGQSTVGGWESGKREPSIDTMKKLADFFDISVNALLGREHNNEKKSFETNELKIIPGFNTQLKFLRENIGLSQYDFSEKIGIPQSTLGGWESGTREPNWTTIQKLADFFSVSIDYLIGKEEQKEKLVDDEQANKTKKPPNFSEEEWEEISANFGKLNSENKSKMIELMQLYLNAQNESKKGD